MSSTKTSSMNDVVNVNSIKQSKLFKKFLETELSDGDNTSHGFQESPFKKQVDFHEKDLENILRGSQMRNGQGQQYNSYQDHNNINMGVNTDANLNTQNGFQQQQHSYFQPPVPQFHKSTDMNNTTQSLNLSQQILDNQKKLSMSPERFYFNPPAIPSNKKNNQTIAEDDQEIYQQSEQSQNQNRSNNQPRNESNIQQQIIKINNSQKQTPFQQNQHDRYQQAQYMQSYDFSLQNSHHNIDGNNSMNEQRQGQNEHIQLNNTSKRSPNQQYPNKSSMKNNPHNEMGNEQLRRSDLQESNVDGEDRQDYDNDNDHGKNRKENAKNNYQNIDYFDDTSSNYNRTTDKKNNNILFKNRQSNIMNLSHETKNFEKDLKHFQQQIEFQEEQISHIQISFQREQLKNRVLEDTISELRRKIDSLEIEKTGKI